MICDICGKRGARTQRVTRTYGRREQLLVIEDVPVVTCPRCDTTYLTADVLRELERIKLHRRGLARTRRVCVATFPSKRLRVVA